MATTLTSDFKIREDLLYSMFLNRTIKRSDVFNAQSNGAFRIENRRLSGETPLTSQMDEAASLVSRRDVFGSLSSLTDKKITESQVGGPKVRRTLGPIAVTQDAIDEKGWSEADIAAFVSEMFSKQILEGALKDMLDVTVTCINKSSDKFMATKAVFSPKDFLEALSFYGEAEELWRLTVVDPAQYVAGLKTAYDNKTTNISDLAVRDGRLSAVGRPVLKIKDSSLDITDADPDTSGNQAGHWMLFLPDGAFTTVISRPPTIVQQVITGQSQLFIRFQAEYNHVLQPKQHEWVGTNKNPTTAQLKTAASWTDRAKSHAGSIGFGLKVKD